MEVAILFREDVCLICFVAYTRSKLIEWNGIFTFTLLLNDLPFARFTPETSTQIYVYMTVSPKGGSESKGVESSPYPKLAEMSRLDTRWACEGSFLLVGYTTPVSARGLTNHMWPSKVKPTET